MDDRTFFTRALLADWIAAKANIISRTSGSITEDWTDLVTAAKVAAIVVEVPWDDSMVPDYVSEAIAWEQEANDA